MIVRNLCTLAILIAAILNTACSRDSDATTKQPSDIRKTTVTVTTAQHKAIEITEQSIGSLEGLVNPTLAAEMAARVIKVHVNAGDEVKKGQLIATLDASDYIMQRNEARAEVARLKALLDNQTKVVERNRALVDKNFISQNALDNELAQENVYQQQLAAAQARVASINHNSNKSKIYAPVSGIIETKPVDTGDYLRVGDPIVQIVSKQVLRAQLPFPESVGPKLKAGQKVYLNTPASQQTVLTTIRELKPQITEGNRTINVIADVPATDGWQPGASVTGSVVIGEQASSIMLPEQSLVLRPAGEVVYVVRDGIAHQTLIKTGLHQDGQVEITSGLEPDDTVVVDGAGFLTDKAAVNITQSGQ